MTSTARQPTVHAVCRAGPGEQPVRSKFSAHAEAFPKKFYSHDHFDRPFSLMAMKGKLRNQKETDHTNNNNPSLDKERKNNESTYSV
jgi:hypothetical protein